MSWLRRIPAETRIVVLVVFLALFQAILLSIFGLKAIQAERQKAGERIALDAGHYLERAVAGRLVQDLGHYATEALDAAFVEGDPARLRRDPQLVDGVFTDAYLVAASGEILEPGARNEPVVRPRERVRADADEVWRAADAFRKAYRNAEFDEAELTARALAFARAHPFALDESGSSLALAFASSVLFGGETAGTPDQLRAAHWIGALVEAFGFEAAPAEARVFLDAVEEQLDDPATRRHHAARIATLQVLRAERTRFGPRQAARIHRSRDAEPPALFYVRTKPDNSSRVLVVDPVRLQGLLDGVLRRARAEAEPGVTPRIVREGSEPRDAIVQPLHVLPDHVAVAAITPEQIASAARDGERIYRWIIAFSIVGILAGGLLTARLVMREVKLAKLKSGFVSNVTHELKTPLTSIRMFSDMLRAGQVTDPAEQRECLDVIGQEADRLGALIQKVLDFGRSESPRPRFHWVTGPLAPVVEREVERFRRATGMGDLMVEVAVNQPPVVHDPDAFADVIANLLSNAYKYSPADEREIAITLGPQRGRMVLAVEDNGPGVPVRERRKIFEQFYRADDRLTRAVEGTGLGLSIARNIVRAHGGRIEVEDREGGGSRFVVVLPTASRRPRSASPQPVAESAS
ncbi:MAG: HAMP domain-containing sensor histidine kinase [Planctomycetota bacterium]